MSRPDDPRRDLDSDRPDADPDIAAGAAPGAPEQATPRDEDVRMPYTRLPAARTRQILAARFAAAGIQLVSAFPFRADSRPAEDSAADRAPGGTIESTIESTPESTIESTIDSAPLVLTLDGYDAERRVGYLVLAEGSAPLDNDNGDDGSDDGDRATPALDGAVGRLADADVAYILLVRESDVPNADALERRIDAFFRRLPPHS